MVFGRSVIIAKAYVDMALAAQNLLHGLQLITDTRATGRSDIAPRNDHTRRQETNIARVIAILRHDG